VFEVSYKNALYKFAVIIIIIIIIITFQDFTPVPNWVWTVWSLLTIHNTRGQPILKPDSDTSSDLVHISSWWPAGRTWFYIYLVVAAVSLSDSRNRQPSSYTASTHSNDAVVSSYVGELVVALQPLPYCLCWRRLVSTPHSASRRSAVVIPMCR